MRRIVSIDIVRGLVMIIMALDHVRDLMHQSSLTENPTDLATTSPGLFMTRWVTHLCAPTFVFLSGTSAYLTLQKHGNWAETSRRLRTRGWWLILLEFTLVNLGLTFDPLFRMVICQVIAAIGIGWLFLSVAGRWSARTLALIGGIIVLGHGLVSGNPFPDGSPMKVIWAVFFSAGFFPVSPNFSFLVIYPWVPWLGILLLGFAAGRLFEQPDSRRSGSFLRIGLGALAAFAVIRSTNFYGDPAPWSFQKEAVFSFLSFINTSKYPPSLLFTLMTLGCMFLLLYMAEKAQNRLTRTLAVYGKVPLFYYLIHWYVVHSAMFLMVFAQGYHWNDLQLGTFNFGRPSGAGISLWGVYAVWASIVLAMYPLCRWYGAYKAAHPEKRWLQFV